MRFDGFPIVFKIAMKQTLNLGLEDNLNIISISFSMFFLVGLKSSCIPKFSPVACLIMEIARKWSRFVCYGKNDSQTE